MAPQRESLSVSSDDQSTPVSSLAFISTTHMLPYAGSEELWCRSAAHLARMGHHVEANVCYVPWPSDRMTKLTQAGCQIRIRPARTPLTAAPHLVLKRLRKLQRRPIETMPGFRNVRGWLRQFRPDLVTISQNLQTQGSEWMEVCQRLRLPYAILVQAVSECDWPTDEEADSLRCGFDAAVRIYVVATKNLNLLRDQLGLALPRSSVVRNPTTISHSEAAPAWPDSARGFKVACVARLHPRSKGQDLLLRVLAQEKWRSRPVSVTLFGDGPNRANIVRLIDLFGLANVSLGGFAANVRSIWSTHHALVLPSRYEGLPLALVEAMLCSRTAIVTDVAGNAELIEDNVTGFIAAAASIEALDEAMDRAWSRRSEWEAIGGRAAERTRRLVPADPAQLFADEVLRAAATRP